MKCIITDATGRTVASDFISSAVICNCIIEEGLGKEEPDNQEEEGKYDTDQRKLQEQVDRLMNSTVSVRTS
jgi:hypothetical protein